MAARRFLVPAAFMIVLSGLAAEAHAQNRTPFSDTYRRPAVSPYTMLASGGGGVVGPGGVVAGTFNPLVYQQLIQPREEQERQFVSQMQQGREINGLQNQVKQIQRGTSERQVNEQIRPTGHSATFQNLSHFYPGGR